MERRARTTANARRAKRNDWSRKTWRWVFGAVAAGLATIVTGAVVALPALVRGKLFPQERLTFTVEHEQGDCMTSYVIPKKVQELGPPPAESADDPHWWSDWALSLGGADAQYTKILITIRGARREPVTVTGLTFDIREKRPALSGTEVGRPCGDETRARFAEVDLDRDPPRITASSSVVSSWGSNEWRASPLKFPYTVSDLATESLLIIARTAHHRVWTAAMAWTDGKETGREIIDFHGEPFRTDGGGNAEDYIDRGDGEWADPDASY